MNFRKWKKKVKIDIAKRCIGSIFILFFLCYFNLHIEKSETWICTILNASHITSLKLVNLIKMEYFTLFRIKSFSLVLLGEKRGFLLYDTQLQDKKNIFNFRCFILSKILITIRRKVWTLKEVKSAFVCIDFTEIFTRGHLQYKQKFKFKKKCF